MAQQQIYDATKKQYVILEVNDDNVNESVTLEDEKSSFRKVRDNLLQKSDWTLSTDSPLTNSQKTEVTTYRQTLRDLPADADFPNVAFPTKPSFL